MIDLIFYFGGEVIFIRINNHDIRFSNSTYGTYLVPIDGLNLNHAGVVKEFPDLDLRDDWKEEAIKRFKEKISKMESEEQISNYIIEDLKKYGYVPKYKQRVGFRKEIL